jgi:hypothetical protein
MYTAEDIEFYEKQCWAYEDVQRAEMARVYKNTARDLFLEALYTFTDLKMESEGQSSSQPGTLTPLTPFFQVL